MTGLGRTKIYGLIGNGRVTTTTVGRRRLIIVQSLLALVGEADKRENVVASQPRTTTKDSVRTTGKQREAERSVQDALEDDEVREALKRESELGPPTSGALPAQIASEQ